MKLTIIFGLLVTAMIAGAPLVFDDEKVPLDDSVRARAPGAFAQLSRGRTHYRLWGNPGRPPVVLIHGFNGPLDTWNHTAPALGKHFRVLAYDLFGRGYSDRPTLQYDLDLFTAQLDDLLRALDITRPVYLVASSFGSVIAADFASRYPDSVARIVLIGPAGFPAPSARLKPLLAIPHFSSWLFRVIGDGMMMRVTRAYYVEPERHLEAHEAFRRQLEIHGFKRAALSTMRHSPLHDNSAGWSRLGATGKEILLIWGREDVSFPYANHSRALELMPAARLITIERAAHLPHYEQPKVVNPKIVQFLLRPK